MAYGSMFGLRSGPAAWLRRSDLFREVVPAIRALQAVQHHARRYDVRFNIENGDLDSFCSGLSSRLVDRQPASRSPTHHPIAKTWTHPFDDLPAFPFACANDLQGAWYWIPWTSSRTW